MRVMSSPPSEQRTRPKDESFPINSFRIFLIYRASLFMETSIVSPRELRSQPKASTMSYFLRRLPLSRLLLLCGVLIGVGVGATALATALGVSGRRRPAAG